MEPTKFTIEPERRVAPSTSFPPFPLTDIVPTIAGRFEQQVAQHATRLAIKIGSRTVTYAELNQAANRLAWAILAQCGPGQGQVALLLERNEALIVALLGVLKTGKCYVPLDPALPLIRLRFMLEHSQASVLVTNTTTLAMAHTIAPAACQVLNLDQLAGTLATENPQLAIDPDALCSILYTSGSTGQPKGVMRTHRQQLRDTRVYTTTMHLNAHDRLALLTFGTGQAMQTLFSALLNGAALYPYNVKAEGVAHLAAWLLQEQITIYTSGTPLFRHFLDTLTDATTFPQLRLIRLGSEAVSRRDVARFQQHFASACRLLNTLSTTETGPICLYPIDKATQLTGHTVPVGYTTEDVEVFVLDDTGTDVGVGQVGEMVVKGHHFALGYWRQPELTGTVFHPDPHASGARFYRTGDIGRRRPDGSLEHLGRKGGRIKIRGYSVEVAEVEAALQALDQVYAAAVMVRQDGPGAQRLVAYVVPAGQPVPTVTTLRHSLAATLADYMIPATFMLLDTLPLAASGKVDRQALPIPPQTRPALQAPFVPPSTPVETTLAAIWAEVLGLDQVGLHDHFLELGGNSLLATQVVARVHATWQVAVPLQTLLETPTVAHMAVCITQHLATGMTRTDLVHLLATVEGLSEDATQAPRTPPAPD